MQRTEMFEFIKPKWRRDVGSYENTQACVRCLPLRCFFRGLSSYVALEVPTSLS